MVVKMEITIYELLTESKSGLRESVKYFSSETEALVYWKNKSSQNLISLEPIIKKHIQMVKSK